MATTTSVIEDLVQTLEDGKLGFEKGAEKLTADGDTVTAKTFREFSVQRARFSTELRALARTNGETIDESGSLAGTLHRGWLSLKDALTGNGTAGVLDAAEQGEDHAKSEFKKALDSDALQGSARDTVSRQYEEIVRTHDQVRDLRTAAENSTAQH